MSNEADLRAATMTIISRFCEREGFAVPQLTETDDGARVMFTGKAPDGRVFALGYDRPPAPPATAHASTSPGPINCNIRLRAQGHAAPAKCERCGLQPCPFFHIDGRAKGGAG